MSEQSLARVEEFVRMARGVLVIRALVPRGGPQKLHMTDLEAVVAELAALKVLLRDPAVKAVVELAQECDRQARRAEAAHEQKDEANNRWLAADVECKEWKRKANDAAATLGHNRVATNAAGDQVAKLRRLLAGAALFGGLPDNLMAEIADAIPGYDKMEAPRG